MNRRKDERAARRQQRAAALNYAAHLLLSAMPLPTSDVITKRERRSLLRIIGGVQKRAARVARQALAAETIQ